MAAPALEDDPAGAADDAVEPEAPAQLPQSEAPLAPAGIPGIEIDSRDKNLIPGNEIDD